VSNRSTTDKADQDVYVGFLASSQQGIELMSFHSTAQGFSFGNTSTGKYESQVPSREFVVELNRISGNTGSLFGAPAGGKPNETCIIRIGDSVKADTMFSFLGATPSSKLDITVSWFTFLTTHFDIHLSCILFWEYACKRYQHCSKYSYPACQTCFQLWACCRIHYSRF
jgi:hypothetical protein